MSEFIGSKRRRTRRCGEFLLRVVNHKVVKVAKHFMYQKKGAKIERFCLSKYLLCFERKTIADYLNIPVFTSVHFLETKLMKITVRIGLQPTFDYFFFHDGLDFWQEVYDTFIKEKEPLGQFGTFSCIDDYFTQLAWDEFNAFDKNITPNITTPEEVKLALTTRFLSSCFKNGIPGKPKFIQSITVTCDIDVEMRKIVE